MEHKCHIKGKARKVSHVDSTILCHVSLLAYTWGHRTQWRSCHRLSTLYVVLNKYSLTRPNPKQPGFHTLPLLFWQRKWEIIISLPSFWDFPCLFLLGWCLQMQLFHCSCGSPRCRHWERTLLDKYCWPV